MWPSIPTRTRSESSRTPEIGSSIARTMRRSTPARNDIRRRFLLRPNWVSADRADLDAEINVEPGAVGGERRSLETAGESEARPIAERQSEAPR